MNNNVTKTYRETSHFTFIIELLTMIYNKFNVNGEMRVIT